MDTGEDGDASCLASTCDKGNELVAVADERFLGSLLPLPPFEWGFVDFCSDSFCKCVTAVCRESTSVSTDFLNSCSAEWREATSFLRLSTILSKSSLWMKSALEQQQVLTWVAVSRQILSLSDCSSWLTVTP